MKKSLLTIILVLLASVVEAQQSRTAFTASPHITTSNSTCTVNGVTCLFIDVAGYGTVGVQVTGTWTGTLTFEETINGALWEAVLLDGSSTLTANAVVSGSIAGKGRFRVRASSSMTGAAVVAIMATPSGGGGGSSGGAVSITQGGNTAAVNASSQLSVTCANCSGTGVSLNDNTTFVGGTNPTTPASALYDTTPPAITDGNAGIPRMDSSRYLYTVFPSAQLVTLSGTNNINTVSTVTAVTAITNALPAGNANIGDVDIATIAAGDTDIGNVDLEIAGTGVSTGVGASGAQTIRTASLIHDGTDTLLINGSGEALVTCSTCSGSGVSHVDNNSFTGASDDVVPMAALFDATPPAITDGNAGLVRMDSARYLYTVFPSAQAINMTQYGSTNVVNGGTAGTIAIGGIQPTGVAVSATNPVQTGGRGQSTAPTAGSDGQVTRTWVTLNGATVTSPVTFNGDQVTNDTLDAVKITNSTAATATSYITIRPSDGTNFQTFATDWTIGTAFTTTGPGQMCVYQDFDGSALATLTNVDTELEAVPCTVSIKGVQYTMLTNEDGSKSPISAEDTATADLDSGLVILARRTATPANTSSNDLDLEYLQMNAGRLWTSGLLTDGTDTALIDGSGRLNIRQMDPCSDYSRITSAPIDTTTNGNVQVVALNGSDLIYVCGYKLVTTTAESIQFIYGTGSACGTGETDFEGPAAYAANGGALSPNTGVPQFIAPAGNALCIETNGTSQVSGYVTYVRTATP